MSCIARRFAVDSRFWAAISCAALFRARLASCVSVIGAVPTQKLRFAWARKELSEWRLLPRKEHGSASVSCGTKGEPRDRAKVRLRYIVSSGLPERLEKRGLGERSTIVPLDLQLRLSVLFQFCGVKPLRRKGKSG